MINLLMWWYVETLNGTWFKDVSVRAWEVFPDGSEF
jgi:hypothetical protein